MAESANHSEGSRAAHPSRLRDRKDFLSAARALRVVRDGFVLQARQRDGDDDRIRVGFTCSKKVGNAVERNRAKRRLREIARMDLNRSGQPGWDYVLIGRRDRTADIPFERMRTDFRDALKRLHDPRS